MMMKMAMVTKAMTRGVTLQPLQACLPSLVLQLLGLAAAGVALVAAGKLAIKTLSTEISHSCFF